MLKCLRTNLLFKIAENIFKLKLNMQKVYIITRISGLYGPLKILVPAEILLASLTIMFASLTKVFALLTRKFA